MRRSVSPRSLFVYVPLGSVLALASWDWERAGAPRSQSHGMGVVGRAEHEQTVKFSMDATRRECECDHQQTKHQSRTPRNHPFLLHGRLAQEQGESPPPPPMFSPQPVSALKAERSKKKSSSHGGMGWGKTKGGPGPLPR